MLAEECAMWSEARVESEEEDRIVKWVVAASTDIYRSLLICGRAHSRIWEGTMTIE